MNSEPVFDEGREGIDRRTLASAALWAAPVVALAVATPLAAASPGQDVQVDLSATARIPNEAPNGQHLGDSYYQGPRVLSFRYTFANLSATETPAGSTVTLGLPFPAVWETAQLRIISSGPYTLQPAGTRTIVIGQDPLAYRQLWDFTLMSALPAGASFDVVFDVPLNGVSNTATDGWRVRPTAEIAPPAGVTDTDSSNNFDPTNVYVYFNNSNASTP